MRICLIGNARAFHLQRWAIAYRNAGHDVSVLSIRAAVIPGVPVHTVSVGEVNDPSRVLSFLSYARLAVEARRAVGRCDPDVIHAHFTTTSGVFARASGRRPIVLTAWGSDVVPRDGTSLGRLNRSINRWALAGADRVTVASRFLAEWVRDLRQDVLIDVVPFGVDTEVFHPRATEPPPDSLSIGLVKSLEPRYGIEYAIHAMPQILAVVPNAVLSIAGDGSLSEPLKALAARLDLGTSVRFLGRIEHDDVPELMRTFDILLNTTIVPESFGVVILEGSATGIPVVSSDVGGVREVCINEQTAILLPQSDAAAIAATVIDLARDPARRADLGRAGRAFVSTHFEWRHSVESMLDVLADAVSSP